MSSFVVQVIARLVLRRGLRKIIIIVESEKGGLVCMYVCASSVHLRETLSCRSRLSMRMCDTVVILLADGGADNMVNSPCSMLICIGEGGGIERSGGIKKRRYLPIYLSKVEVLRLTCQLTGVLRKN